MQFSTQEYLSGFPFLSPEELPNPGIKPWSPASQTAFLPFELHLSNGNAGVLRRAQGGQKPPVEQKGKSSLDLDFQ